MTALFLKEPFAAAFGNNLFWDARKNVVFFFSGLFWDTPAEVVDCIIPSSQPHQSVPKVPTCVSHFHLTKGDEMSVHFRNCWTDFDICCFELASLDVLISADARFKAVGGEIWYPSPQWERWSQKTPYCLMRKNVIFSGIFSRHPKKCHFFGVRKNVIFSDAEPDVVDHPESTV